MAKNSKRTVFARRAWNLLRLALLWARKGGAFKRGLMVELRLLPNYIKSLKHAHHRHHNSLKYQEREFSFDETPLFHFKMHRPNSSSVRFLPCIKPQVDFDFDFDEVNDEVYAPDERRQSTNFLRADDSDDEVREEDDEVDDKGGLNNSELVAVEDEAIDLKAEEFIARFYEQMKLQRQISYLQYTEMLDRGVN